MEPQNLNPSQEAEKDLTDPKKRSERLKSLEKNSADAQSANNPQVSSLSTKDKEEAGGSWNTNLTSGLHSPSAPGKTSLQSLIKKSRNKIIISVIVSILGFFGVEISVTPFSLLAVKANGAHAWDHESSFRSKLTSKLSKRFFQFDPACVGSSKPSCFMKQGMTDKQVKALKDAGLSPDVENFGKDQNKLVSLTMKDPSGKDIKVDVNSFADKYLNDPTFRSLIDTSLVGKSFAKSLMGKAGRFVVGLVRGNINDPLGDSGDEEKRTEAERQSVYGDGEDPSPPSLTGDAGNPTTPAEQGAVNTVSKIDPLVEGEAAVVAQEAVQGKTVDLGDNADALNTSVASDTQVIATAKTVAEDSLSLGAEGAVKGALAAPNIICMAYNGLSAVVTLAKTIAVIKLAQFALVILTIADKIKSGHAAPAEVSALMAALLLPGKDGKNFFQSNFFSYFFAGGKISSHAGLSLYTSGTPAISFMSKLKEEFNSYGANASTCGFITSWIGQIFTTVVGLGLDAQTLGVNSIIGLAIGVGLAVVMGVIAGYIMPIAIRDISGAIAPDFKNIQGGFAMGNAFFAGVLNLASLSGRALGLRPLKKPEIGQANIDAEKEVAMENKIANAHQNPFSLSNPQSITSQFAIALAPLTSGIASNQTSQTLASIVASPFQLLTNSIGSFAFPEAHAAGSQDDCQDSQYNAAGLYGGPTCALVFDQPSGTDPQAAIDYMISNHYVTDDDSHQALGDYASYLADCVNGQEPMDNEPGSPTAKCLNTNEEYTMFSIYAAAFGPAGEVSDENDFQNGTLGDVASAASTGGGAPGTAPANAAAAQTACIAPGQGDNTKALDCEIKYDDFGYLWGGGHSGTPQEFLAKFYGGAFKAGQSSILDCSGIVRMAVYEAWGVDIGGGTELDMMRSTTNGKPNFMPIPNNQAQPGDFADEAGVHIVAITDNHPSKSYWDVFAANTDGIAFKDQIGYGQMQYAGFQAYRYVGPKLK